MSDTGEHLSELRTTELCITSYIVLCRNNRKHDIKELYAYSNLHFKCVSHIVTFKLIIFPGTATLFEPCLIHTQLVEALPLRMIMIVNYFYFQSWVSTSKSMLAPSWYLLLQMMTE